MMTDRLPESSTQVIDRSTPVTIYYRGKAIQAFRGDTVASALHSADVREMASSFKYHRPRGIMDLGVHATEPLMKVDGRINSRIARTSVRDGMKVEPQSKQGMDVFKMADWASGAMETGFYYKSKVLYNSKTAWNKSLGIMRTAPGNLPKVTALASKPRFEEVNLTPELLVIGGGPAGIEAAIEGAKTGIRVVLVEAEEWLGGFEAFQGVSNRLAINSLIEELNDLENVTILNATTAASVYPDGLFACVQVCAPDSHFLERSYLIRPKTAVFATGAMDRPLLFNNNDRPGIMLPQTAHRMMHLWALKPGEKVLLAGGDDYIYKVALDLVEAGVCVECLCDLRVNDFPGEFRSRLVNQGVSFFDGWTLSNAKGKKTVTGAEIIQLNGVDQKKFKVDTIIASCGRTPLFKLIAQTDAKIEYSRDLRMHLARIVKPNFQAAGRLLGLEDNNAIRIQGRLAAANALVCLGMNMALKIKAAKEELADAPPIKANPEQVQNNGAVDKRFICFSNDVTEKDIEFALGEGFNNPEMIKRYTTAIMGPDQGSLGQINYLECLARKRPEQFGRHKITTPRPPIVGVSMGALSAGLHDQPRITPLHHIQTSHGGKPIRSGPWLRIEDFGKPDEESLAVRNAAAMCDVSSLGKFRIFGPDADKLLNRINTKRVDDLAGDKILYVAACNEEGVFIDDGIIVKLGDHDYYFTTSSARAPSTKQWYLRWCREEDWKVWLVDLTDAKGGINLAGPNSREILSRLTDSDISNQALRFMNWIHAEIAGVKTMVFRMGFLGELSYEIHAPASQTTWLWQKLLETGEPLGLKEAGLETQLRCRLEKGHVLPGLDADGNTTLWGSHMGWIQQKDRWDNVGGPVLQLLKGKPQFQEIIGFALEGNVPVKDGHIVVSETRPGRVGHITSVRYSPTLDKTVGLALVEPHLEMNETGELTLAGGGREFKSKIAKTPFYDPKGERLTL